MTNGLPVVSLREFLTQRKEFFIIDDFSKYKRARVQSHGQGIVLRDEVYGSEIKTKKQQAARPGEFLVAEIDAKVGGFGIVPPALGGVVVSSHYFLFQINENKCSKEWLNWFVRYNSLEEQTRAQGSTNYAAIRPADVLNFEIPLPPLTEQRRIVAHIESLARRVDEAQRLREEADIEAAALHGTFAAKALKEVSTAPKHSIAGICEVRGGIQKSPVRLPDKNPTPYLTVAHVQRNFIDVSSEPRYFEVSLDELPRWKLEIGDLLIIEGNGSADQIGRVALYRGELGTCVHQNHVIRARPNHEIILSEYLNMYLNSPLGQDEVQKRSRTTSGLRTLSVGRIREIEIPVPPLDEQRRIVAYLDGLQAKVNALRELQFASGEELSALMPSILDKAFKGEL